MIFDDLWGRGALDIGQVFSFFLNVYSKNHLRICDFSKKKIFVLRKHLLEKNKLFSRKTCLIFLTFPFFRWC